jgi:hypothetical protein
VPPSLRMKSLQQVKGSKKCERGSSVGTATGYGLDDRDSIRDRVNKSFSVFHIFQTGLEAHPVSYPMGTGGHYSASKATGARS